MRRFLNLLIVATLFLFPSFGSAAARRAAVRKPAAVKTVRTKKPKSAMVPVRPYVKKNGKLVKGTVRTPPNSTQRDNYSSRGNVNPMTGKRGTKIPKK